MCLKVLIYSDYEGLDTVLRILSCKACFCFSYFSFLPSSFFWHALVLDSQLYERLLVLQRNPASKLSYRFINICSLNPSISNFLWLQEVVKLLP